ncbi:MAG: hypothetical protein AB7H97_05915 [Pseudobdellovibrionaceae bacterium]
MIQNQTIAKINNTINLIPGSPLVVTAVSDSTGFECLFDIMPTSSVHSKEAAF